MFIVINENREPISSVRVLGAFETLEEALDVSNNFPLNSAFDQEIIVYHVPVGQSFVDTEPDEVSYRQS